MIKRALLSIGLIVAPSVCFAGVPALLILPFDNATDQPGFNALRQGLPDLLTVGLGSRSDQVRVVERQKLEAIMAEQSLKWENVMTEKGSARLSQLVQAKYLLRGSVMPDPKGVRIQASLYETETTRLIKTFDTSGPKSALSMMADVLAADISSNISLVSRTLPVDWDPELNQHLMRGLGLYYQNEFPKAIPEFMKVLEKHPKHADARYWLYKSYLGAGLKDDAAVEAKAFMQLFPSDRRAKEMRLNGGQKS